MKNVFINGFHFVKTIQVKQNMIEIFCGLRNLIDLCLLLILTVIHQGVAEFYIKHSLNQVFVYERHVKAFWCTFRELKLSYHFEILILNPFLLNDRVEWLNKLEINIFHCFSRLLDFKFGFLDNTITLFLVLVWHKLQSLQPSKLVIVIKDYTLNPIIVLCYVRVAFEEVFEHVINFVISLSIVIYLRQCLYLKHLLDLWDNSTHIANPYVALSLRLLNLSKSNDKFFLTSIFMHALVTLIDLLKQGFSWQRVVIFFYLI